MELVIIEWFVDVLNNKLLIFPFVYLSFPIAENPKRVCGRILIK